MSNSGGNFVLERYVPANKNEHSFVAEILAKAWIESGEREEEGGEKWGIFHYLQGYCS